MIELISMRLDGHWIKLLYYLECTLSSPIDWHALDSAKVLPGCTSVTGA